MPQPDQTNRIDETDAKAGSKDGVVRWVLLFSLALAIIAMTIIWVTGALTQNADESQGTATGRAAVEAEAVSDGQDIAEEAGLVSPGTEENTQPSGPPASGATTGPN